ncbi:MAG: hypothetical protein QOG53_3117 [Frankiales bacterium]|jgi:hypothetical protein|nr:hypothetical protein [Frankiales bacterium]
MFARLLAPFVIAFGLVAPATMPAAHAAPTDAQMVYFGQGYFAPQKTTARLSQALAITNLSGQEHTFTVTFVKFGSKSIRNLESGAINDALTIKPWSVPTVPGPTS